MIPSPTPDDILRLLLQHPKLHAVLLHEIEGIACITIIIEDAPVQIFTKPHRAAAAMTLLAAETAVAGKPPLSDVELEILDARIKRHSERIGG